MKLKILIFAALFVAASSPVFPADVLNFSFEEGLAGWEPRGWNMDAKVVRIAVDKTHAHHGKQSIKIEHSQPNDAMVSQRISVEPDMLYRFSSWARTKGVVTSEGNVGASIGLQDSWIHSADLKGTNDWTLLEFYARTAKDQKDLFFVCRLGFWGSTAAGEAWFDEVKIEAVRQAPKDAFIHALASSSAYPSKNKRSYNYWLILSVLLLFIVVVWLYLTSLTDSNDSKK